MLRHTHIRFLDLVFWCFGRGSIEVGGGDGVELEGTSNGERKGHAGERGEESFSPMNDMREEQQSTRSAIRRAQLRFAQSWRRASTYKNGSTI